MNFVRVQTLVIAAVLAVTPIASVSQRAGGAMGGGSPGGVGPTGMPVPGTGPASDSTPGRSGNSRNDSMAGTRGARERDLWRKHRDELDLDSQGHLVVRSQVVALVSSPEALAVALDNGFTMRRRQVLEGFGNELVVFEAPNGMTLARALKQLRKLDPGGTYDFNHVYLESGEAGATGVALPPAKPEGAPQTMAPAMAVRRVGLVDRSLARLQGLGRSQSPRHRGRVPVAGGPGRPGRRIHTDRSLRRGYLLRASDRWLGRLGDRGACVAGT